jgi:ATP-dependent RNA helicase HelY
VEARRLERARQESGREVSSAAEREGRLEQEVKEIERALEAHPCHACPVRSEHEHALRRELAAVRQLADAERHTAELEQAAASQAQRTLASLTTVMARFGFLEQVPRTPDTHSVRRRPVDEPLPGPRTNVEAGTDVLRPTELSAVLSRVYDPNGLLLLSMVWRGTFDHLAPAELMELLSWFCYDREGPRWNRHQLTPRLWDLRPDLGAAIAGVQRIEQEEGIAVTTGANSAFFGPVLAWCRGAAFAELLEQMPISEGDLLLALNKTLDLGAQLREALRTGAPENAQARRLAAKLDVGDHLLRRGIVAQSLRLAAGVPGVSSLAHNPDSDLLPAGEEVRPSPAAGPPTRRRSSPTSAR